jgi:translation initiation factor 2 beta subunit (eIF-2beta)/eIF-5
MLENNFNKSGHQTNRTYVKCTECGSGRAVKIQKTDGPRIAWTTACLDCHHITPIQVVTLQLNPQNSINTF